MHLLVPVFLVFFFFSVSSVYRGYETAETSEHFIPCKNETNKPQVFNQRVITAGENKTVCISFETKELNLQH